MRDDQHTGFAGPAIMFVSALIFGYFGFSTSFIHTGSNGQLLFYVPLLEWTLKVSAVAFVACGLITLRDARLGNFLYAAIGLLGSLALVTVAVMDFLDTQHTVMSPVILLLFAAFNGYCSWHGLRVALAVAHQPVN